MYKVILRIIAVMFIFGGGVRLFASQDLFDAFGMDSLWSDHPYFIYIYRVLGAFVILTGMMVYAITFVMSNNRRLMNIMAIGFIMTGLTMAISGYLTKIHIVFYITDFLFCFVVAYFLFRANYKVKQS